MKNDLVKLSIILFLISSISALLLAGVYNFTQPVIAKNEVLKEQNNIKVLMPNVKAIEKNNDYYIIYSDTAKKDIVGYVFKTAGKGYGGKVVCNVGIDKNGDITGVVIISQAETPGLGSKIEEIKKGETEPYFLRQFKGKSKDNIKFDDNKIQAISGATISSTAVLKAVQKAFELFEEIKDKG